MTAITCPIRHLIARTAAPAVPLRIIAATPLNLTAALRFNAHHFHRIHANQLSWCPSVALGDTDYSGRITGTIRVQREVNAAAIAEIAFAPAAGAIDPEALAGQPITIHYKGDQGRIEIFKGTIVTPSFNTESGVVSLLCSDLMQEKINTLSQAQIDAVIPHVRSPALYQAPRDHYDYAQECLNSAEGDMFLGLDGGLKFAPWSVINPIPITCGISVTPRFSGRQSMINRINLSFEYRHLIGWHREWLLDWEIPHPVGRWLSTAFSSLPDRAMIEQAIPQGLVLQDADYTDPPPSGSYTYLGAPIQYVNYYAPGTGAYAASLRLAERWLQTISHTLELSVAAPASISAYGPVEVQRRYALNSDEAAIDCATILDNGRFGTNAGFDDAGRVTVPELATPTWSALNYNTWRQPLYSEQARPADADGALTCMLREAARTILEAHQNAQVTVKTLIKPLLTLADSASVAALGVSTTGRIKAIIHELDTGTGSATTTLTVVPVPGPLAQVLTAPAIADSLPDAPAVVPPPLESHFGGLSAPPQEDDWLGYVGNLANHGYLGGAPSGDYQPQFNIEIPAVADDLRDAVETRQIQTYSITIYTDKLSVTV